jgi:hypothetical protein
MLVSSASRARAVRPAARRAYCRKETRMPIRPLLFAALAVTSATAGAAELTGDCKPVWAAMEKTMRADHTASTVRDGTTIQGVTAGGVNYVQIRGTWRKSPMSVQQVIEQQHDNLKDAKEYRCQRIGDSTVDGAPVTLYKTQTVNDSTTGESTIAISRSDGVAVQVDATIKGDANMHFITHYAYGNVKPPM